LALRDDLSGGDGGLRIAVVGDVHLGWSQADVDYFNASDYDLVLFVGDLAAYAHRRALDTARSIGRVRIPALVIAGNHDGVTAAQLIAEVAGNGFLCDLLANGQERRCRQLALALHPLPLCGYSRHDVEARGAALSVIAARPHSMGGARMAFRRHLAAAYGVGTMEESTRRLCRLVDEARHDDLLFFAHNGPSGLGAARDDIWGCDFRAEAGDFGDPDLAAAIAHAAAVGKRPVAVVAGHMHHRVKGGGKRTWLERRGDILYVNAARVPRILRRSDPVRHHHVRLEVRGGRAEAREMLVSTADRATATAPRGNAARWLQIS
jgi:uncharacterized protein (TIGR04168 family)